MSPERANILYVEDNDSLREVVVNLLTLEGHAVLLEATTYEEALKKITLIPDKNINVVVLDGNLSEGDLSGADGENLANLIKEQNPDIKIIGFSGSSKIPGVDLSGFKSDGPESLLELVRKI